MITPLVPMTVAMTPARMESEPRLGPTVRSSTTVSLAGRAPERRTIARSVASWVVKRPEILPEPPRIGSLIPGAVTTLLSSTIAKGRPTFSRVSLPNRERALLVEAEADDRLAVAAVVKPAGHRSGPRRRPWRGSRSGPSNFWLAFFWSGRASQSADGRSVALVGWLRTAGGTAAWRSGRGILEAARVLQARNLDEDAVHPLALDVGSVVPRH